MLTDLNEDIGGEHNEDEEEEGEEDFEVHQIDDGEEADSRVPKPQQQQPQQQQPRQAKEPILSFFSPVKRHTKAAEPSKRTSSPKAKSPNPKSPIKQLSPIPFKLDPTPPKMNNTFFQSSDQQPLTHYEFSYGQHWFVVVFEAPNVNFSMKVLDDRVEIAWTFDPPYIDLYTRIAIPERTIKGFVKPISGQFPIMSPAPLINHPQLIEKLSLPGDPLRILKIPFYTLEISDTF